MYEKNGCKEILFVDSLESHEKTCRFEKRTCVLCACEVLKKHNCIESLLKKNKELVEKVEILEKNLSSSLKHNITLNKNIEKKNSELEKVSKELAEIHKKPENKKKYEVDDVSKKAETHRKREVDLPLPSSSSKVYFNITFEIFRRVKLISVFNLN
jgi:DNA repair exonuclease SbcCD ATPase subunit